MRGGRRMLAGLATALLLVGLILGAIPGAVLGVAARAEYGDVVLNDRAGQGGMRPVVFPHWLHRTKYQCRVCHQELGFQMRVGGNGIQMSDIYYGRFCGECHNGETTWGVEYCGRCHSGTPGLETGVQGGHRTTGPGLW